MNYIFYNKKKPDEKIKLTQVDELYISVRSDIMTIAYNEIETTVFIDHIQINASELITIALASETDFNILKNELERAVKK